MLPDNYKFQTTFRNDFSIADAFGDNAITDTFNRAFSEWKNNLNYMKELVLILNWKCWEWYEKNNEQRCELYREYYEKSYNYGLKYFKKQELSEYLDFLD